jgi:hypothetical protein
VKIGKKNPSRYFEKGPLVSNPFGGKLDMELLMPVFIQRLTD